ncbi:hypothetical protein [Vibrio hippocampi]|uniref:Uncharacterized protein n=1 Tax=Vibrio hippocampi TaxID=654686 RepID=A0ABM8ZM66_9VIBR|nr:hypothetical protein [Vibrio hippocampi]CAH0529558.1 hypothetical protein VHP8226_03313 [Vibrio hippocampi]
MVKVASHVEKTFDGYLGIALLTPKNEGQRLQQEIWGVGRRKASMLNKNGIFIAAGLARIPLKLARQVGSVNLEQVVRELKAFISYKR